MGSSYLDGNELRTRALNWSDSLAARTQEAVRIGTLHDSQVLIVHHVFRPDDTSSDPRCRLAAAGARDGVGQGAVAHHPIRHGSRATADDSRRSPTRPSPIPPALDRECTRVRVQGWSTEIGELFPQQVSIAAPIMDRQGIAVGAIAIFGGPSVCSPLVSRGVISCGTCATQPARCHASSGRSPGRDRATSIDRTRSSP